MISEIKSSVSILDLISKDLNVSLKSCGTNTFEIEETKHCPHCDHKNCFKVFYDETDENGGRYKCFSCDAKGDVISWTEYFHKLTTSEAIKKLAKDFDIKSNVERNPIQEIFDAAALYYSTALLEGVKTPSARTKLLTPLEYQLQIRKHSIEALKTFKVGWSDGGLVSYLDAFGYDEELVLESGLKSKKTGKDFLPDGCFIYPHFVNGKVSHWTFKDPTKRLQYQLPSKHSLNGYTFYNSDSIKKHDTIIIVEGENDVISCAEQVAEKYGVIGTIGSISGAQVDWLISNMKGKNIVTMFDPDDAGNKYRQKLEKLRQFPRALIHVMPPDEKDIDQLLKDGGDLETIVNENQIKVVIDDGKPVQNIKFNAAPTELVVSTEAVATPIPTDSFNPDKYKDKLNVNAITSPDNSSISNPVVDSVTEPAEQQGNNNFFEKGGCYYKIKSTKDGDPQFVQVSNFVLKLKNVYITEDNERQRELIAVRDDGLTSEPFKVNSEDKVTLKNFRVIIARVCDGDFRGTDADLATMWAYIYAKDKETFVNVIRTVGRNEKLKAWIFRNVYITDSGAIIEPDKDNIFWMQGHTVGIKAETININSHDLSDMPILEIGMSKEDTTELTKEFIVQMAKNIGNLGAALTMMGWMKSIAYDNTIFETIRGAPYLFLHGSASSGKGTICSWMQEIYGLNSSAKVVIAQIKSGAGLARKLEYYSSLPFLIDEIRHDNMTDDYTNSFRGYYDREGRPMGTKDGVTVRTQAVRSRCMFAGEDTFSDPATRMRCVSVRIPKSNSPERETSDTYTWMEASKDTFSAIGFQWLKESVAREHKFVKKGLKDLAKHLILNTKADSRKSMCWATAGLFGMELAAEHFPEFDYSKYLIEACAADNEAQKHDNTVNKFFQEVESIMSEEGISKISHNHVGTHNNLLYLWFDHIFRVVELMNRGRSSFSRNAILNAIREEPYFVSDKKKTSLGQDTQRRTVLVLDMDKAPDVIKNIGSFKYEALTTI